ncbi:hypothetical protein MLD38_019445 [Melastoma candidum]|uniref:Uncharacterized protein n=1 Tax=Melastoma candidum TaxID=119954 RepID=A0ACB9R0I5_9MYRT|nr:hypothetical protein MLD38_019445 [Melastoma candidum]
MRRSVPIPALRSLSHLITVRTAHFSSFFQSPQPSIIGRRPLSLGIRTRYSRYSRARLIVRMSSNAAFTKQLVADQSAAKNRVQGMKLLSGKEDYYGGVIVEMDEPMEPSAFLSILRASISNWRVQGKKGVWIKLTKDLANLIESAVKEGFNYHHAEKDYLMLVYWIPETPDTIPANATHRVGIGAVVFNEKNEVLVVQENSGRFQGSGVWKFPTGVVDEGEDICTAAQREVKEETGINAEFIEVLAFRQSHKSFFTKSDLFFVCLLRPLSLEIQLQEVEIAAAKWMPFEEFKSQPFSQKNELLKNIIEICSSKKQGMYSGFTTVPTSAAFSDEKSHMYLNSSCLSRNLSRQ